MSIPLHIVYTFSGILGALALPTQRYELVYFCDGNHGCLLVRSTQMSSAGFLRLACFYCACTPQRYYELIIDATKVHTMNICDRILENGSKSHIFISVYLSLPHEKYFILNNIS